MKRPSSQLLLDKLINNDLSLEELNQFLLGLKEQKTEEEYSEILKKYFEKLLEKNTPKAG